MAPQSCYTAACSRSFNQESTLRKLHFVAVLLAALPLLFLSPATGSAQQALDYDVTNGHFYTQADGAPLGTSPVGYAITNDDGVPFWDAYQKYGGPYVLGYPVTGRFVYDGFVTQAMQKAVFQWRPELGRVLFLNTFDALHDKGLDGWLQAYRQTPPPFDTSPDTGLSWDQVKARHLAFLDQNQAIKTLFLSDPAWLDHYGLPVSYADEGNSFVIRAQRATLQYWKQDVPWAKAGDVSVANGGDLAKEAGLWPANALVPQQPVTSLDHDIPNGHFFTQANGQPLGTSPTGYAVTNDAGIPFWDEFKRLGGPTALGYPVSQRFIYDGFVTQAMQKVVFQWRPDVKQVWFLNTFDALHDKTKDDWLLVYRQTPKPFDTSPDTGLTWDQVVARHQGFLDQNQAIKKVYFADPSPIDHFGLPVAYADEGNSFVIRAQRATFQYWKEDVPWAKAGDVSVANGGDLAKEAGLWPANALVPQQPVTSLDHDIPNGHFFTQANGQPLGTIPTGYAATNDRSVPFWDAFQQYGGQYALGYPVSQRFIYDGFVTQAMQKVVFQWRPDVKQVWFLNTFDALNDKGKDDWLLVYRQTPRPFDTSPDTGLTWDQVVARHQGFLDQNQAIKKVYFADPSPIDHFGLPLAYADEGNSFVIRAQRATFQYWKEDVPWAKAGDVSVANGGDLAKEAGLWPANALVPQQPVTSLDPGVSQAPPFTGIYKAKSPEYGMNIFLWGQPATTQRDLQKVQTAGFGWQKALFQWRAIEGAGKGQFDWREADRVVKASNDAGIKIIARVDFQPGWARADGATNGPPDNFQDYSDFMFALVDRYKTGSPFGRVHAVALWNEPNLAREWGDKKPDAVQYVALLKAGYEGSKKADPNVTVISAKQIWLLEFGWTSDEVHPEYAWHRVTEAQKAQYIVDAYKWAATNWSPWIGVMTVWNLPDPNWTTAREEYWWSIANADGSDRPAYTQLRQARQNGFLP